MSGFFSFGRDSVEAIQPTRDHWVPDAKAIFCAISGCERAFSLLERRHHCRRCGEAVCRTHFGTTLKLNQYAVPDENGVVSEVCDDCYLTHQRRQIKISENEHLNGDSEHTNESHTYFQLPKLPDNLIIPESIKTSLHKNIYVHSIISHLGEVLYYFNNIRKTLHQCRDSALKREYLLAEKTKIDQMLTAIVEHENALKSVMPSILDQSLSNYIQSCLTSLGELKDWLASTEIYMLRSGNSTPQRALGMLPEEDFAIVEERIRSNERLAESLMARLFEVSREDQEKLLVVLKFVKARLAHDYHEYLTIPGPEMESFRQRLEKSLEYIDLHSEMCNGSLEYIDLEATINGYEKIFYELLSQVEDNSTQLDKNAISKIKTRSIDLTRDISVCKSLLLKSTEASLYLERSGKKSMDSTGNQDSRKSIDKFGNGSIFQPLINRMSELEENVNVLEQKINQRFNEPSGLPMENFQSKASEFYQTLQVQRANESRNRIESEMFDL